MGRRKQNRGAKDFAAYATLALDQMIEGVNKTGVGPEFVLATDRTLNGYLDQGVRWHHIWTNACLRNQPLAAMLNFEQAYRYAGGNTTVLQFGSSPYWLEAPQEDGGYAPDSILAFLGRHHRTRIAESSQAPPELLDLLAGNRGQVGDGDGVVRTTAFMNLAGRGYRALPGS